MTIPDELKGKALFEFLLTNKKILIAEKKAEMKRADAVSFSNIVVNEKGEIKKAEPGEDEGDTIQRTLVINTTKWLDSHRDVHLDGLWKKSLSENKDLYLLQEHSLTFKNIITDSVSASAKKINWKTLGVDIEGTTEALLFNVSINKDRNPFMFDQYKKGYVKNHSVGMRYVQLEMAINDEEYPEEFAVWNKYFELIANKDEAEAISYFFAVKEAKVIEGSAVPIGSNRITPVLDTSKGPQFGTPEEPSPFDWSKAIKETKFINL